MKRSWLHLIAVCLVLSALGIVPGRIVHAQSESLSIGLLFPNEGETFYANPLTFIYSFKLRGWVESASYSPEQIEVDVRIIQDGRVVNSRKIKPEADGLFSLPITANPNSDPGSFTQFQTVCRIDCHYTTDFQLPEGPVTVELTASTPDRRIGRPWSGTSRLTLQNSSACLCKSHWMDATSSCLGEYPSRLPPGYIYGAPGM